MASISIKAKIVKDLSPIINVKPYHMYILYQYDNGEEFIIRGGPEGSDWVGMLIRDVEVTHDIYDEKSLDFVSESSSIQHEENTIFTGTNTQVQEKVDLMLGEMNKINMGNYDYNLPVFETFQIPMIDAHLNQQPPPLDEKNSNTVVMQLAKAAELDNEVMTFIADKGISAPGHLASFEHTPQNEFEIDGWYYVGGAYDAWYSTKPRPEIGQFEWSNMASKDKAIQLNQIREERIEYNRLINKSNTGNDEIETPYTQLIDLIGLNYQTGPVEEIASYMVQLEALSGMNMGGSQESYVEMLSADRENKSILENTFGMTWGGGDDSLVLNDNTPVLPNEYYIDPLFDFEAINSSVDMILSIENQKSEYSDWFDTFDDKEYTLGSDNDNTFFFPNDYSIEPFLDFISSSDDATLYTVAEDNLLTLDFLVDNIADQLNDLIELSLDTKINASSTDSSADIPSNEILIIGLDSLPTHMNLNLLDTPQNDFI